jgi:hypothetical protein
VVQTWQPTGLQSAITVANFQLAVQESKTMGMLLTEPEHICIALCKSKETGAMRAIHACALLSCVQAEMGSPPNCLAVNGW